MSPRLKTPPHSPTLVGDSPPPRPSRAGSSSSPRPTFGRQTSAPSNPTSPHTPLKSAPITTPSISTRKKPTCRTCGEPMKGHKRDQCQTPLPTKASKSLFLSSPENERTPTRAPPPPSRPTVDRPTPPISAMSAITSASGRRRAPQCRKCNGPMKGHKRRLGVLMCPVDVEQPSVAGVSANLLSTPSSGGPSKIPKEPSQESLLSNDTSISHYAPVSYSSQFTDVHPSMLGALYQALGEPEAVMYVARNREVLRQIRNKAKALRYFSGVVDANNLSGEPGPMACALTMGGSHDLAKEREATYRKLVLLSENEDTVRKCIDVFKSYPLRV